MRRLVAGQGGAGLHTCKVELYHPEGGGVCEALALEVDGVDLCLDGRDLTQDVGEGCRRLAERQRSVRGRQDRNLR